MGIVEIITMSTIGTFALIALIGFIRGYFKGTFRSLMDIGFVLVNTIASILITKGVIKLIAKPKLLLSALEKLNGMVKADALGDFIVKAKPYLEDGKFLAEADLRLVTSLPAIILAPIIFLLIYIIMGSLLKILKLIIQKLFIPKTKNVGLRLLGGVFGASRLVLGFAIFLVPIIGFATYGVETIDLINGDAKTKEEMVIENPIEEYREVIDEGAVKAINTCGGKWLFKTLTTTQVDDVKISLVDETDNAVNIYNSIKPITKKKSTNFTNEETKQIDNAIDEIEKSEFFTALIADVMAQTTKELHVKHELLGYKLPYYGESFDPAIQTFLQVWSGTTREGLVNDLRTYAEIFKHTVDFGLYRELNSENGDVYIVLEDGNFYSSILTTLYINERTRPTVPSVANAMQSYLHEVYEHVNGKPYHEEVGRVDESRINEGELVLEGNRIAKAIEEIRVFSKTVEQYEYVDDIVKVGDFAALGRGLNQIRDSVYFGKSYKFLLYSILHSESCANLGIFDSHFINNATQPGADMEALLLSRQNLATLTMAMWDNDTARQKDSLVVLIEKSTEEDSQALKELSSLENLEKYGVKGEKGKTVSSIASSLAETIHTHEYVDENGNGSVEDEKHAEAERTAEVLTILNGVHSNKTNANDVFGSAEDSKTGVSAEEMVDKIFASEISKEMIQSAVAEDKLSDEPTSDPYNIQKDLSDGDKASLEAALQEKYAQSEDRQSVENIAYIFGIKLN